MDSYQWSYEPFCDYNVLESYSIISVFSSSLKPFDPKRNVSTIVYSSLFNKERLVLLIFIEESFSLIRVIWAVKKEVNSCFDMPTTVAKLV